MSADCETKMDTQNFHQIKMKKPKLFNINPLLTCGICSGYLIDAIKSVECFHSFCRSCIVKHLQESSKCPICDQSFHKIKPHLSLRPDKTLQDIIYKVVPKLYQKEFLRRKSFYSSNSDSSLKNISLGLGSEEDGSVFYLTKDQISVCLDYGSGHTYNESNVKLSDCDMITNKRYLLCPSSLPIAILKKFILKKYDLIPNYKVDIMYQDNLLDEDFTLMDIALIYSYVSFENHSRKFDKIFAFFIFCFKK